MREIIAFIRRDALVAASYRVGVMMSLVSLVALTVPVYFIAEAIQPLVGDAIASEGGQYFAFVIAGLATFQIVNAAVAAIPTALATGLRTGTFEALLTTPARLPALLAGMLGYPLLWSMARAIVLLTVAAALGAPFAPAGVALAPLIWLAIALAYVPFGLLASAFLVLTRTAGPIPAGVLTVSMFLGGVYYPTNVIPSWLQSVCDVVPLTYGLRALRRTMAGEALSIEVGADLAILGVLACVLLLGSMLVLEAALRHARRSGNLAQY